MSEGDIIIIVFAFILLTGLYVLAKIQKEITEMLGSWTEIIIAPILMYLGYRILRKFFDI